MIFKDLIFLSEQVVKEPYSKKKFLIREGEDEIINKAIREKYQIEDDLEIKYYPATFEVIRKIS